jgi:FAD/FMN-containing dehydrogenase
MARGARLGRRMAESALDELRSAVVDDRRLRERLLVAPSREAFVAAVVELAHARGIELTPAAVNQGLAAARRDRWARWV